MFSLTSWSNSKTLELFQSSKPYHIVGLWSLSQVEGGLKYNIDLAFNSFQDVKIKFEVEGFEPNLGSFIVTIDYEGKYNIQGNTLITDWDSNTAKVSIVDLQYTDAINDYIKAHPEAGKKIQDTINQSLRNMLIDLATDTRLINNKTTIYSISDKELVLGDSHKKESFKRTR